LGGGIFPVEKLTTLDYLDRGQIVTVEQAGLEPDVVTSYAWRSACRRGAAARHVFA
jgi:hypothetical protein